MKHLLFYPIALDTKQRKLCEQKMNVMDVCPDPAEYVVESDTKYGHALCREHARKIIEAAMSLMSASFSPVGKERS